MVTTDIDVVPTTLANVSVGFVPDTLSDADRARLSRQCLEYADGSLALLRKAERCRKNNELAAACLYGWGAAEDITKAVGENWKDYGVTCADERDLRTLVNALVLYDSEFMQAVAAIHDSESEFSEKQRTIGELVRNQPEADRDNQLDVCFRAAESLRETFYEGYQIYELLLERDLKRVANFVARMFPWLRQPYPPDGFRQCQWQEPFTPPNPERAE